MTGADGGRRYPVVLEQVAGEAAMDGKAKGGGVRVRAANLWPQLLGARPLVV